MIARPFIASATPQYTLIEYLKHECWQLEVLPIGLALYHTTEGRMCGGCPKHDAGSCLTPRRIEAARRGAAPVATAVETVREEAARLGVSISEVRRRRNAKG